jgi:hypothetical protein
VNTMMRVLMFGGRSWENEEIPEKAIKRLVSSRGTQRLLVITGGAPGLDMIAEQKAHELGVHVARVEALWDMYNRAAGPMRNAAMAALSPHLALGFHWDLNDSKGTKSMVEICKEQGIQCKLILRSREVAMPSAKWMADKKAAKKR